MLYDDKKFIGTVIKNARKKAGLTQAQLSEKLDMCDKNLGNIENGKQFPQVNNFLKVIETLNLSLKDFGVNQANQNNNTKDKIIRLIHESSDKKNELYLEALTLVDKIYNLK